MLQASIVKDATASVTRVTWSPDGTFMGKCVSSPTSRLVGLCEHFLLYFHTAGAAFTKHLVHLYAYTGSNDLRQHLEVSWEIAACPACKILFLLLYLHPFLLTD